MVFCVGVVCFLMGLVVGRAQDLTDIDGFSNDSPFNVEPKVESIRVKIGTPITLKCQANQFANHTIWEYKECVLLYKGIDCDLKDIAKTSPTDRAAWKRRSSRQRFEIGPLQKNHSGVYRCVERGGIVKKSIVIEVVGQDSYDGPPPSVQSLLTSNITGQLNVEFTIQCNVTSVIPPTVIWFKKCFGSKCDIEYDDVCYCHLNVATSSYNVGNTYISKLNIFNAKGIDSGVYACLAVTEYGKDYKYVTINVPDSNGRRDVSYSLPLLFLVPLALVVAPILVWLCYFRKKTKKKKTVVAIVVGPQQQALLKASGSRAANRTIA